MNWLEGKLKEANDKAYKATKKFNQKQAEARNFSSQLNSLKKRISLLESKEVVTAKHIKWLVTSFLLL